MRDKTGTQGNGPIARLNTKRLARFKTVAIIDPGLPHSNSEVERPKIKIRTEPRLGS